MAAHRYWRICGFGVWGAGNLTLTELQLFSAAGRVDNLATLTSSVAPATGSLSSLADNSYSGAVTFAGADVRAPSFNIVWDFSAGNQDILIARFGADSLRAEFVEQFITQYSDDNVNWTAPLGALARSVTYPGSGAYTDVDISFVDATALLHMDGTTGGTTFLDSSPNGNAVTTSSGISIGATTKFGSGSASFPSSSSAGGLLISNATPLNSDDFRMEFWVYPTALQSSGSGMILVYVASRMELRITTGGFLSLFLRDISSGANTTVTSATLLPLNTWTFVSLARTSGSTTVDQGGSLVITNNQTSPFAAAVAVLEIGGSSGAAFSRMIGFLDEFQMQRDVSRRTAAVPTTAFSARLGVSSARVTTPVHKSKVYADYQTSQSVAARLLRGGRRWRDIDNDGRGYISGTTKNDGTPTDFPVRRRVRLMRDKDGIPIRETWSDAVTGAYLFTEIDERFTYTVTSYDHTENFRAVIADRITPELMT